MKIAFATAQSLQGSTNVGRIIPLVKELQKKGHACHVLTLATPPANRERTSHKIPNIQFHTIGAEPFRRTEKGKKRLRGVSLLGNIFATALGTTKALYKIKPDVIVMSKPLPANVTGVWLYTKLHQPKKLVLDADDFELTANKLTSIYQRAVIHWSERIASALADVIVTASPFLSDHFKQLTQNTKPVEIIVTGIQSASGLDRKARPLPQVSLPQNSAPHPLLAYLGSVSISSGHRVDLLPLILEKVVASSPNARLLIAGDGDDVASLKKEFGRRNLAARIIWQGRFTLSEVEGLITTETIILDPIDDSIANRAKSSFRVMLAGLLGHPVVTSNIGIRPELLPEQLHSHFFAEPGDSASYAEKILDLVAQPLTLEQKNQLRNHAQQFTWEKLTHRFEQLILA